MMASPSRRVNAWFANALVFRNGHPCRAHREETHELLPRAQVDLVTFDPPYATEFSTTNYEKSYHFVEGLMTYWKGLEGKAKDEDEKGRWQTEVRLPLSTSMPVRVLPPENP